MILVTGGTGLVGSHLLYFLLKENKKVRAIHRKNSNLEAVKTIFSYYTDEYDLLFNKIEWVEADITDIPALTEAFDAIAHVYHAAAYISFDVKHFHKLKKANIEGTANIVNLCLANKVEKLCYVSSVATLGKTEGGKLITEETVWNPEDNNSVYAISKYGAEMEIWRGTQEGLDCVIVNPGVIIGEGFWNSGSGVILKIASKGIPYYTLGGVGIVDVKDVVKAMILLMNNNIKNKKYILVGKNILYKDLLSLLAKYLEKEAPKKSIPKGILLFFSRLDWLSSKLFGTKRKLLKATVNSLFNKSYYDASKIKEDIDFDFTPYQETLKRVSSFYLMESFASDSAASIN